MEERRGIITTCANQKGGVGKSTTTLNLAAALGELGRSCLVIDLDMSGGVTKYLGAPRNGVTSTYDVLTGDAPLENAILTEPSAELHLPRGVHLVPSSRELHAFEEYVRANRIAPHRFFQAELEVVRARYDFLFIDTPPQVTKPLVAAFCVSDVVLVAAKPEDNAISAIGDALQDIRSVQESVNRGLTFLGVVLTDVPRPKTILARRLIGYLEQHCPGPRSLPGKFFTEITRTVVIQEAEMSHRAIFDYQASHPAADEYRSLAKEFENRVTTVMQSEKREVANGSEAV